MRVDTVLFAVLVGLVVHLAYALGFEADLTQHGRHSLSDEAAAIVSRLERPLRARVVFSEGLRPPVHGHRDALLDLLAALSRAAKEPIVVTTVDPGDDPLLAAEARALGVQAVPYAEQTGDQTTVKSVYLGLVLSTGARQVVLPVLPSVERMEAQVVTAIAGLLQPTEDRAVIGWWIGHGEPDPSAAPEGTPLRVVWDDLRSRGAARTFAPFDAPIPADIDLVVLAAPRKPLHPAETVHLDRFLHRGGRLLAFLSSFRPDYERAAPVPVDHGLHAYFGALGVTLGKDLLLDRTHHERLAVPIGAGRRVVEVRHPLALVTRGLERTEPSVLGLPRLVLPFASSVTPVPSMAVDVSVWASTEPTSSALRGLLTLDPSVFAARMSSEQPGPFPVAVALSGVLPSAFAAGPLPTRLDPAAEAFDRSGWDGPRGRARMVVVGSADAVANNPAFVGNAVDWLLEDGALFGLRSRLAPEASLPVLSRAQRSRIEFALVAVPLLVLGFGLGLALWRSR